MVQIHSSAIFFWQQVKERCQGIVTDYTLTALYLDSLNVGLWTFGTNSSFSDSLLKQYQHYQVISSHFPHFPFIACSKPATYK
jgi:hypothetical protein